MKGKRVRRVLVIALVFSMCIPFSVSADSGNWEYLGSDVFKDMSKVVQSSGGEFRFCISRDSAGGWYELVEYDPESPDESVGYFYVRPGDCAIADVSEFVDGADGKAGLYLYIPDWSKDRPGKKTKVTFWD